MIVLSPETKSSLIVQLRSGTTLASALKRAIAAAWSTHSPSLLQDWKSAEVTLLMSASTFLSHGLVRAS
jgi:hypothetical protein